MNLVVGSVDWDHDAWAGSFYPQDLPREWRLSYYANEFSAVLVPRRRFTAADVGLVEGWREDVPAGFTFWVEVAPAALARVGPALRVLGPCLGGVVAASTPAPGWIEALGAWVTPHVVCAVPRDDGQALPGSGAGMPRVALVCDAGSEFHAPCAVLKFPEPPPDNRRLAAILRALAAAAAGMPAMACFPGTPRAPQSMEQAQVILDLLGA